MLVLQSTTLYIPVRRTHYLFSVQALLGLLVRVFITTVNNSVRTKSLSAITKILYFSSPEMLKDSLKAIPPPPNVQKGQVVVELTLVSSSLRILRFPVFLRMFCL